MQDGALAGARFDHKIDAGNHTRMQAGDIVGKPALSANDANTVADESRTELKVGGATFAIGDLLGAGAASSGGKSFVDEAVAKIQKVRADVEALLGLSDKPRNLDILLHKSVEHSQGCARPGFQHQQ